MKRQEELNIFAIAPPGLERVVAGELKQIGIPGTAIQGGVEWKGDFQQLRRANLYLRTASRVVVRVAEFRARTFFELERHAAKVDWRSYLSTSKPVLLRVTSKKSKLYHEGAIAERLLRAIREKTGAVAADKLDEDAIGANVQLFIVRVSRDEFTISADSSGALLHFRGYRQDIAKAPLRENLAASLIQLAGWDARTPLLDPFCGSGTIPIEAALIARNIPPALAMADRKPREFAFEHWPIHDRRAWETDIQHARGQIRNTAAPIFGSDRDYGAIDAALANAERAGVNDIIRFAAAPLSAAPHPSDAGVLVTNPPYGVRVSEDTDLRNLYAALGRYMREELRGWRLVMMSADAQLEAQTRLALRVLAETKNGGIAVRVVSS